MFKPNRDHMPSRNPQPAIKPTVQSETEKSHTKPVAPDGVFKQHVTPKHEADYVSQPTPKSDDNSLRQEHKLRQQQKKS